VGVKVEGFGSHGFSSTLATLHHSIWQGTDQILTHCNVSGLKLEPSLSCETHRFGMQNCGRARAMGHGPWAMVILLEDSRYPMTSQW